MDDNRFNGEFTGEKRERKYSPTVQLPHKTTSYNGQPIQPSRVFQKHEGSPPPKENALPLFSNSRVSHKKNSMYINCKYNPLSALENKPIIEILNLLQERQQDFIYLQSQMKTNVDVQEVYERGSKISPFSLIKHCIYHCCTLSKEMFTSSNQGNYILLSQTS